MRYYLTFFAFLYLTFSFGQEHNPVRMLNSGIGLTMVNAENSRIASPGNLSNTVFIQQVGNRNYSAAKISAEESKLDYTQIGNDNFILVHARAKSINENVIQNGNNNSLFDFVNDPTQEVSLNLIQNGDNIHFARYGSNSIGNRLNFKITGDSKAIIIRNFK